ncbi:REP-associated tyrosine transposase [Pseudomonas sp. NPDC090202]|uniref:REP-associated tyrosine transposase n=1 Tax=unclassified Pseudomonas TaxID=196821 RepID=UPI0038201515
MSDLSHSQSLRDGRFSETGQIYMVTSTVVDRRPVFSDWRIGRLLVAELKDAQERNLARSLAWVIMPDHFHWLLELQQADLSTLLQQVKSRTCKAVNRATGSRGSLWQDGFHDIAVREEDDLVKFARYIVANPLRAGLVSRLGDYPLWDAVWLGDQAG